jgi:SAM-dependent methyltransferase
MNAPPNFDRLARLYRWMEFFTFGPWLSFTRSTWLCDLAACRRALVLGDGDGRFTARLLRANPSIQVHAVDSSSAMLETLLRRVEPHDDRVRVQLADVRSWHPPTPGSVPPPEFRIQVSTYDLIVTHFFLDCLTTAEIQSLAARLYPTVAPNAVWLVSEFAVPPGWYGRHVARPVVRTLYHAFAVLTGLSVPTLPDHPSALHHAGFTLLKRRTRLAGLLVSELWATTFPQPATNPTQTPSYPG